MIDGRFDAIILSYTKHESRSIQVLEAIGYPFGFVFGSVINVLEIVWDGITSGYDRARWGS